MYEITTHHRYQQHSHQFASRKSSPAGETNIHYTRSNSANLSTSTILRNIYSKTTRNIFSESQSSRKYDNISLNTEM